MRVWFQLTSGRDAKCFVLFLPREYDGSTTRDDIIARVSSRREELRALGVVELSLFGSFARGDDRPGSDLDFLVDFRHKSFDGYMAVKELLESLFGREVDLVLKDTIKPRLREVILREAVRAA